MCTVGMKDIHWERVSLVLGFVVNPEKEITLKRLIELEVITKIK